MTESAQPMTVAGCQLNIETPPSIAKSSTNPALIRPPRKTAVPFPSVVIVNPSSSPSCRSGKIEVDSDVAPELARRMNQSRSWISGSEVGVAMISNEGVTSSAVSDAVASSSAVQIAGVPPSVYPVEKIVLNINRHEE